ncbi:MAG: hypothetical protein ACLUSP_05400 [Christensenellales bacterium]
MGSVTQNGVSSQVIPAGFDGKITIPFSSFVTPDWKELPDHASRLDLDDIASLTLTFMLNDTYSKGSLALSDFALEPNVEVNFSTKSWFQWEDGRYLEFVPNGHKAADGADFTPDKTATFNGKEYVLDEDMSRYLKTDAAAYTNGRPAVRRSGGAVTVNYRPNLYYRLKDDFTLEKAFYPAATKTVYPKERRRKRYSPQCLTDSRSAISTAESCNSTARGALKPQPRPKSNSNLRLPLSLERGYRRSRRVRRKGRNRGKLSADRFDKSLKTDQNDLR